MSITYSAGAGTVVTSYAMNETLGSQTNQTGNNTVVVSNTLANTNNGQIGTKYTTYVGRLVVINHGGTEQIRMCTAQAATGTGTEIRLTVHEDWDTNPVATTDSIYICYDIDDCETGFSNNGIALSTKTGLYELSNTLTVGNGTAAAGLQLTAATGLECDDQGSGISFFVTNNAKFLCGYVAGGSPVSGGVITSYNNTDGEPWMQWQSGSTGEINDTLQWAQLKLQQQEFANGSSVIIRGGKNISGTQELHLFDTTITGNHSIAGENTTAEFVRLDAGSTIDGMILAQTYGLNTASGSTSTETITLKNVTFIGNGRLITLNSNKTWNVINPVWTATSHTSFSWDTTTSNQVNEKYSLEITVQQPDGTGIASPRVFVYRGLLDAAANEALDVDTTGDGNGVVDTTWTYRSYITNSNTDTYTDHALRVYKYGKTPFIAAITDNAAYIGSVTLINDANITEATQATALTNGSGITVTRHATGETDTRPMKVLKYDAGTGSVPTVGETITSSGASGTLVEYIGDAVSGTLVLDGWNGTEFSDNTAISGGTSSFAATTDTTGFYEEYTWEVDCNSKNLPVVYDYLAAKMAQSTLDATFDKVHEWGADEQGQLMYADGNDWATERNVAKTEGVWIHNFGTGTISYLTADDGTVYIPPVQYSFTLTNLDTGSVVRIFADDGDYQTNTLLAQTDSSGTSFSYNYIYPGSDQNIYVVVISMTDLVTRLFYTLSNANQSVQYPQSVDRVYST